MVALIPRKTIRLGRDLHGARLAGIAAAGPRRCRRKFLRVFPKGFGDPTYAEWERGYKARAHQQWTAALGRARLTELLAHGDFRQIANDAVRIESRTNLLFSFEKMALRDAVRSPPAAERFARGLFDFLHGHEAPEPAFHRWVGVLAGLPRRGTRVVTWPVATVLGFIAQPDRHVFLKPIVTRIAAREYGFDFKYSSRVVWPTYASLLNFARTVRRDTRVIGCRDMIDAQSFIWVQGSDEYADWKS